MCACVLSHFSCVLLCAALWTVSPPGFSVYEILKNTGVDCHALLHGIFLTQGSNLCLFMFPALAGGFLTTSATQEAHLLTYF